ncbi:MFS domain-containing protein [Mycena chlorophos]|uniref:MFS domain-containing protein n=1 Tax=Mycena chlorophos TaxID=658473 RepID=A0A8H6TQ46_MYCCL|nr:MFS domain-containing protein [Mycena chlorophos]
MSRSRSRPRSVHYPDTLLPDVPVDDEALDELIHARDETLVDGTSEGPALSPERSSLPWWRRPSPWWLVLIVPFTTVALSSTLAAKVEVYTLLACAVHKPEVFKSGAFETTLLHDYPTVKCAADPVVAAAAAKLNAAMTTSMGILSCLTTGFWSSLSDRVGRTRMMTLTVMGGFCTDVIFVLATTRARYLPGGYWFLLVGPAIEGSVGGFSTGSAAAHAYLADVSGPSERSRIFALFLGTVFLGIGFGPTLGSILVKYTGNLLSVFYFAASAHLFYGIMAFFVIPESLSARKMKEAKLAYAEEMRLHHEQDRTMLLRIQRLFGFLRPLLVVLPGPSVSASGSPKGRKWDWNLTLSAIAFGCVFSLSSAVTFKTQYLMKTFGWTTEYMGYFLTTAGSARAVYMVVLLPFLIKHLKARSARRQGQTSPSPDHSPSFDLGLAKISVLIDMFAFGLMTLATSVLPFLGASILNSFGAGFGPALQSVALELHTRRNGREEAGKLFGAFSIVQAFSGQVFGPSVYGFVFVKTVATFPKAIFLVSLASVTIAFICVSLIRLPPAVQLGDAEEQLTVDPLQGTEREALLARDATLVDIEPESSSKP